MDSRRGACNADYQSRVRAFNIDDRVYPLFGAGPPNAGIVKAVWPAIGMVDVQFPHGTARYPVEDLIIDATVTAPSAESRLPDTIPSGAGTVSVPGGPYPRLATPEPAPAPAVVPPQRTAGQRVASTRRVASAYVKKAVYWASKNRKYKMTKEECASGNMCCPRCSDAFLRPVVYKREEGKSVKLLCCPECLFLLRRDDVLGLE